MRTPNCREPIDAIKITSVNLSSSEAAISLHQLPHHRNHRYNSPSHLHTHHNPSPSYSFPKIPLQTMSPPPPKMKLIYHPLSPYSRKVYMLAHELSLSPHITLQKVVVCPIQNYPGWSDNNADLVLAGNPLAKIPTLILHDDEAGNVAIFDSRAICETLREMAGSDPVSGVGREGVLDRARERTLASIADGILDAHILITYENTIRKEKNIAMPEWIEGQNAKIQRGFDALERDFAGTKFLSQAGGIGEVAVAVVIDCTEARSKDWDWRVRRPKLAKWWEEWRERDSYRMTKPSLDWKTGGKADLGPLPADPKVLGSRI